MIADSKLATLKDLTKFAPAFLTIKNKAGRPVPFELNQSQMFAHNRLEAQLKAMGRVRALILKGRQMGMSTYIGARYFHKVITRRGLKAFILTHESEATKNLFEMTKRYNDTLPEGLCPLADRSSAKELKFTAFDSGYSVGTAGNTGVGRSQTIQLLHGSEVAFWPNAELHDKGVIEAVSGEAGTEIILESTANGIGNYFHNMWKAAHSGTSEYQAIFIPWYWMNEYRAFNDGFRLDDDEQALLDFYAHDGLTVEHLAWRRVKINKSQDIDAAKDSFCSEYPMSAEEAFRNPIDNVFINAKYVMRARKNDVQSESQLIIGVDPAISDKDKTAIIRRRGRKAYNLETFRNHNTMEIAGRVASIIRQEQPAKVYIDCIGIGAGIVDRLNEMGLSMVEGINVGRTANNKERFANLRAELWSEMRDWLYQNELSVQIPDDDELHGALCSLGFKYRSNEQLLIESKDDLRARGMPSPDEADALSLTFFSGVYGLDIQAPHIIIPRNEHRSMFT